MDKTEDIEAIGNKYNRIIGTGFIVIAVLIICINMVCRFVGSRRSMDYEYVDGVVTRWEEKKSYPHGVTRPHYDYMIWIEYFSYLTGTEKDGLWVRGKNSVTSWKYR